MQQKITKEGSPVHYVNLPSEELKKAAIAQLKDGQPVWFGCDVGQRYDRASGLMNLNLYHLEDMADFHEKMNNLQISYVGELLYGNEQAIGFWRRRYPY